MVKDVVKPNSHPRNRAAIIANSYRQVTKRFTPCRVFSSAVSIAYYQELVKRLLSTLKNCIAVVKENARRKKPEFIFEKVLDFLSLLWYGVVLTGGTTHEKYDSLPCAFALLRSELVATP